MPQSILPRFKLKAEVLQMSRHSCLHAITATLLQEWIFLKGRKIHTKHIQYLGNSHKQFFSSNLELIIKSQTDTKPFKAFISIEIAVFSSAFCITYEKNI